MAKARNAARRGSRPRYFASGPDARKWGVSDRLVLAFREVTSQGLGGCSAEGRPSAPPVLVCGLCVWASCAIWFPACRVLDGSICLAAAVAAGIAVAATAAVLLRRRISSAIGVALLGVVLGLCSSSIAASSLHSGWDEVAGGGVKAEGIVLEEDARAGTYGRYAEATVYAGGKSYRVRVLFDSDVDEGLFFGERFSVSGTIEPVSEEYAEDDWNSGLAGTISVSHVDQSQSSSPVELIAQARKRAVETLMSCDGEDDGKSVLAALACGYRVDLYESNAYSDFKIVGLAHLVAVSGAHLSLASMLISAALSALRLPKAAAALAQAAFIAAYLVFTGMPISAVRAAIMALASQFSWVARRRSSPLGSLGLCIMVLAATDPVGSVSASFALSALSVLGIAVFMPLLKGWASRARGLRPGALTESLCATLSSNLLSLPLSAALFSQVPLAAPFANLVAAPLFTAVCGAGLVSSGATLISPDVGAVLFSASAGLCTAMCRCVGLVASVPYASVPFAGNVSLAVLATAVGGAVLWATWPAPTLRFATGAAMAAVCVLAAAAIASPSATGTRIVALDVGQGDAILLQSGSRAVLVDTGNQDQKLLEALARHGVMRVDAVVVTHGDDDHMGSLESLRGIVQVGEVIVCEDALGCECANCRRLVDSAEALVGESGVKGVSCGDAIVCGAFRLEVVWPHAFADEGGNSDSLCLYAQADTDGDGAAECSALLVGDAEDEQLDEMLDEGAFGRGDVYKVGHHGSRKAIDEETAARLRPRISLVSVGAYNTYGHPNQSTLDALRKAGSSIYRTDESGDISCEISSTATRVAVVH